tara:strand:- start:474 stop:710 length:237 start_codon:yes stop_codon:yes gene_type:complete
MIPTLDLHGFRHHEVGNEVARFLERWINNEIFIDIVTGNSSRMIEEVTKVLDQYGVQYTMGYPYHPGRIRVVLYDDFH